MTAAGLSRNGRPEVSSFEEVPDAVCADDGIVVDVETLGIEGGDLLGPR